MNQDELDRIASDPSLRVANWDSYDAAPLDDRAVAAARRFLSYRWAIVPMNDGGIQLERHDSGFDMEVSFKADGSVDEAWAQVAQK